VTIRDATPQDIDAMVALGAVMHAESPRFRGHEYAPEKVRKLLESLIGSPRGFAMVADHGGVIEGGMVGAATEHWGCNALVAFDVGLFVLPDRRGGVAAARLAKEFREWCRRLNVAQATAGITTMVHPEMTAALYRAIGFKEIGPVFDVLGD